MLDLRLEYNILDKVYNIVDSPQPAGWFVRQEVQLWQRDRAKFDTFSINVQLYSKNHAQNWTFGPPYGGIRSNICAFSENFNKK